MAWVIVGVVLSPIFIRIPDMEILVLRLFAGELPGESLSNAVSLLSLFIAALGVPLIPDFARALADRQPLAWGGLVLVVYFGALGAVSAARTADLFPIFAAAQYALPIAAVVIGYLFRRRWSVDWQTVLMLFVFLNLLLPALAFTYVYFWGDGRYLYRTLVLTNRYFYALFSHLPTMVLVASILLLGWARRPSRRRVALFAVGGAACVFFTTWSVATLACALVALSISTALLVRRGLANRDLLRNPLFAGCIALLVVGIALPPIGMLGYRTTTTVPAAIEARGDARRAGRDRPFGADGSINLLEKSGNARIYYVREGLRRWSERPLFGVMFEPDETSLIRGSIVAKKQIFQSHNQYVDMLLKTGIVGFLLLAGFYLWFVARPLLSTAVVRPPSDLTIRYCLVVGVLAGIVVAANLQLYLTVWTTAVPLDFFAGYVVADGELSPAEPGS